MQVESAICLASEKSAHLPVAHTACSTTCAPVKAKAVSHWASLAHFARTFTSTSPPPALKAACFLLFPPSYLKRPYPNKIVFVCS